MKTANESIIYPSEKWVTLASFLQRGGIPTEESEMTIQVHGVYAIPEFWLKMEASGSVDTWNYQTKASDILIADGKLNPRELTEDEKKELEAKKKPVKISKKDEVSKEEHERQEKEKKEKEERERRFQEELNALDPMGRFYRLKEIPTNDAWISFPVGKSSGSVLKAGEKLIEIEEDINEHHGMLLEFCKVPPPDENEKKRPKPKNMDPNDIKPIYTVGWVDFSEFHNVPGKREIHLRTHLMLKETYENRMKLLHEMFGIIDRNPNNENIAQLTNESDVDYVEKTNTYIHLTISFSSPINPEVPEKLTPDPFDLVQKEDKPIKQITADEICADFRKELKIVIANISKSYEESIGEANKNQIVKRDKGSILTTAKKEERDSSISKFLQKFVESGKADLVKEKLKRFIVKIVLEKYKKKKSIKGVFKDEKDQFYSELYAYLTDEVKLSMDEFMLMKREELHENITSSYDQSRREIMNYAIRQNKEPEEKRLLRLSKEYELMDDLPKAMFYYKSRLTLNQSKESWINFSILAKKLNSLVEVEEGINNCIQAETNEDISLKLIFAGIKWIKGRLNDAINYLGLILTKYDLKNTNCNFNAFLAFLYKEKKQEMLFQKHYEAAKKFKMKDLGMNISKVKRNPKIKNEEYKRPFLIVEQCDQIWYTLCNLFNDFQFFEVSEKLLEFIDTENKNSIKFKIEQAKILLFKEQYSKVISLCDEICKIEKNNYLSWVMRGHAYYFQKNLFDSEESYVKAIRCKPERYEKFEYIKMLSRLGHIYIKRKTWHDARTVFQQILKDNILYSYAWRFLGLALTRLGEYQSAEEALNEAYMLDVENPVFWAYLSIFCIAVTRKNQAYECLNELMKINFQDIDMLAEIAGLFYLNGEYSLSADLYNKIIKINPHYIDAHIKLSEVYFYKLEAKKKESIEILKNCLKYTDDEKEKNSINDFITHYENQMAFKTNNDINISNASNVNEKEFINNTDQEFFNDEES